MSQGHFHFQCVEFFRNAGFGFGAHLLAGPLLDAVEFLVDIHPGGFCSQILCAVLFVCLFCGRCVMGGLVVLWLWWNSDGRTFLKGQPTGRLLVY